MADPDQIARVRSALATAGSGSSDFDLNPGTVLPPGRKLRPAAVLVALHADGPEVQVVLTKRASGLRHHPGQIAFPGGRADPGDADAVATALREAEEEIGLPRTAVDVLGTLPAHETVTSFRVTPVVARITRPFEAAPEPGEVDEVFSVPLAHVTDPSRFAIEWRLWRGERRYYYTVPWGPYYIWGATARILRALADRMTR